MTNMKIRIKLMENDRRLWWLAQLLGTSEPTLSRRMRNELPEGEQERICKLIDSCIENGGQRNE